jgi:hypothetical protein
MEIDQRARYATPTPSHLLLDGLTRALEFHGVEILILALDRKFNRVSDGYDGFAMFFEQLQSLGRRRDRPVDRVDRHTVRGRRDAAASKAGESGCPRARYGAAVLTAKSSSRPFERRLAAC